MKDVDVLVIGAGPAGMAAALAAAENGRVLLLERQAKCGRRLLASGNGRANVGNRQIGPEHYNTQARDFLAALPRAFDPAFIPAFLRRHGLLTRADEAGRLYPRSRQAQSVVWALEQALQRRGVEIRLEADVQEIRGHKGAFQAVTNQGLIQAAALVVAVGGLAAPQLGGGDASRRLLAPQGVRFCLERPALVALHLADPALSRTAPGVRFLARGRLEGRDFTSVSESQGEYQITKDGLSGIAALRLARAVARKEADWLILDLAADLTAAAVRSFLEEETENQPERPLAYVYDAFLPGALGRYLATSTLPEREPQLPLSRLDRAERESLVQALKGLRLQLRGVADYRAAQLMAGGLALSEVDPRTLELCRQPGLHVAGELLAVDGDSGGYNLHFAFLSGDLAGRQAAQSAASSKAR